jgi:hypothetical protein
MKHSWVEFGGFYLSHGEVTDNIQYWCEDCGIHETKENTNSTCYGSPYQQLLHATVDMLNHYIPFMELTDIEQLRDALDALHNTLIDMEGKDYSLKIALEDTDRRDDWIREGRKANQEKRNHDDCIEPEQE